MNLLVSSLAFCAMTGWVCHSTLFSHSPSAVNVAVPRDSLYSLCFAASELQRFPQAWQLDHGKRLYWGYAQGVGCCAMLQVWKQTGDNSYLRYVEAWADTLINERGEIFRYEREAYNLDYINAGKVLFDLYRGPGRKNIVWLWKIS